MALQSQPEAALSFDVAWDLLDATNGLAFDMGGSMLKIVYIDKKDWVEPQNRKKGSKGRLRIHQFNHAEVEADKATNFIKENVKILRNNDGEKSMVYGAGFWVSMLGDGLKNNFDLTLEFVDEAICFSKALVYMINNLSRQDIEHKINPTEVQHAREDNEANLQMYKSIYGESAGNHVVLENLEGWFKEEDPKILTTPFAKDTDIFPCILALCGSAFGTVLVREDGTYTTISETRRSGKMWLGLGSLLTGGKNYDELMQLAATGNQQSLSLCMTDYEEGESGEAGEQKPQEQQQTAGSTDERKVGNRIIFAFSKAADKTLADFKQEDLAAALLDTVVSDLAQLCHDSARIKNVKHVFLSGGFVDNPLVRKLFYKDWKLYDCQTGFLGETKNPIHCHFLKGAQHYGAFGALLNHLASTKL